MRKLTKYVGKPILCNRGVFGKSNWTEKPTTWKDIILWTVIAMVSIAAMLFFLGN
jgi:hypothetical protein